MFNRALVVLFLLAAALSARADELYVRVVDVGAGLCCVAVAPNGHYMVYDAGNYIDRGATAKAAIAELIPAGSVIDLLVLSHSDGDHVAAVPWICERYEVARVIRPWIQRDKVNWNNAVHAVAHEEGCEDIEPDSLTPGQSFPIGDAVATFICGFTEPPATWDINDDSEFYNAGSIVIRLSYSGRSILLTGDTVGRHNGDPADSCIDAERQMVDSAALATIDSDVMQAPHHGADNGSSTEFIQAVSPRWVIFSAGHDHDHPRAATAQRYLDCGVAATRMYRTDRGDDESEGGDNEWRRSRKRGHKDPRGDDDVEIKLRDTGAVTVRYR